MAIRRNINYINKDFSEYRAQLINYSKTYFPSTYTDFVRLSSLSDVIFVIKYEAIIYSCCKLKF